MKIVTFNEDNSTSPVQFESLNIDGYNIKKMKEEHVELIKNVEKLLTDYKKMVRMYEKRLEEQEASFKLREAEMKTLWERVK